MTVRRRPIADRIVKVIRNEDLTASIEALYDCITFGLAQISCPNCRETFARSIADQLLEEANKRASDLGNTVNPGGCGHH